MEQTNRVLRAGRGQWDGVDLIFVVTETRTTWSGRRQAGVRQETSYGFLTFDPSTGRNPSMKEFATLEEAERWAHLSIPNFTGLDPASVPIPRAVPTFEPWIGSVLYRVCFAEDHGFELGFWPAQRIDITVPPIIERVDKVTTYGAAGYADELTGCVGRALVAADDYWDDGIVLDFEDRTL